MKLFYAMGGGLGHLYRVHTFINQFKISGYKLLTNNPLAGKLFSLENIITTNGQTKDETIQEIVRVLDRADYDELYVDTFPAGLFGELFFTQNVKTHLLARHLKWSVYEPLIKQRLHFDNAYCFEGLEEAHAQFLNETCLHILPTTLQYPKPQPDKIPIGLIPTRRPLWIIVHSFVHEEVESLVQHVFERAKVEKQTPALVVLTDQQLETIDFVCHSYFPARDWFPLADRIFTGGGFNTLHELILFIDKTTCIPFPRKYDDQFWRVQQFMFLELSLLTKHFLLLSSF